MDTQIDSQMSRFARVTSQVSCKARTFSIKKTLPVLAVVLFGLWWMSTAVSAQTSASMNCGSSFGLNGYALSTSIENAAWADLFIELIYAIQGGGACMYGVFISDGADLAVTLFGISLALMFMFYMVEPNSPRNTSNILVLFIKMAVVMAMLANWGGSMQSGSKPSWLTMWSTTDVTVDSSLVKPFDELSSGLFSKYNSWTGGSGGKGAVFNALDGSFRDVLAAYKMRGEVRDGVLAKVENPLAWIRMFLEGIGDSLITTLCVLIVLAGTAIMMITYVFVLYYGDIAVIIGMVCGPLMIPGLLFGPLDWLFTNWLKFMISAGFYKIIG